MRNSFLILFLLLTMPGKSQKNFDDYFIDKTLRFDFMFSGNAGKTLVYPLAMKEEPFWGGPDTLPEGTDVPGNFRYELFDVTSDTLIYVRGFCTLFQEWQTTPEAKNTERSFYEVATMPFPRNKCRFVLSKRERDGSFSKFLKQLSIPRIILF